MSNTQNVKYVTLKSKEYIDSLRRLAANEINNLSEKDGDILYDMREILEIFISELAQRDIYEKNGSVKINKLRKATEQKFSELLELLEDDEEEE